MLKKCLISAICLSAIYFFNINFISEAATSSNSAFAPIKTFDLDKKSAIKSSTSIDLDRASGSSKKIDLSVSKGLSTTIDLSQSEDSVKTMDFAQSDFLDNFVNATDKFIQCNIKAAWDDFKTLINTSPDNDFMYMLYANKMADLGLFDLATLAESKIQDENISNVSMDAMKRFYYPRKKIKPEDELFLAEAYSNISFNNQSSEATNELLSKDALLSNYDYANYLVALGSYKSGFYSRAAKYINIATLQNPSNLNYQRLKAQILADNKEPEAALKTVENLKKQSLNSYEYERKVKSLEQFILYKIAKTQWEKDYHLGYYYYLENDSSRAIRTLQNIISSKKKSNLALVYSLMSEVYLSMNEFEKASDTAKKAYKSGGRIPQALITLGDLSYRNENYKQALDYYKKAANQDKKSYVSFIKQAQTYQKLSKEKQAKEIYAKVLKTHSDSWEAYYNVALLDKSKRNIYLKKALAVNPLYEDAWIELAKSEMRSGNYITAQKYLSNAFYIDENDFRYYYYQGLVSIFSSSNFSGDSSQAKYNFKKCLKLNPTCKEAQKALNLLLNGESDTITQEDI